MLMLTYKLYYIIALPYLGQLTNKKLDHENTVDQPASPSI